MCRHLTRRDFSKMLLSTTVFMGSSMLLPETSFAGIANNRGSKNYKGPNVIIVRYGGGVRRRETIDIDHTYSPFMMNVLAPQATLYNNMEIANIKDHETSHEQGTMNILTGQYKAYSNFSEGIGGILQPTIPTLFEYFRKTYDVDVHETLIINGENGAENEPMKYGTHKAYGADYKSELLNLEKFQAFMLQLKLDEGNLSPDELSKAIDELEEIKGKSANFINPESYPLRIQEFWRKWQRYYGMEGFKNPRGDALSTEIAIWALRDLRPKLMLVNYQDTDHVHFGVKSHYTRGITAIDQGIQQLYKAVETDPFYKDNTVFVIVPDCGRDNNILMDVPFQHHSNSRSTREIFAMILGNGIKANQTIDTVVDQTSVTSTVAHIMGFEAEMAESPVLEEALL